MATATEPPTPPSPPTKLPDHNFFTIRDPKTKRLRTAFAVYDSSLAHPTVHGSRVLPRTQPPPPPMRLAPTHPNPLLALQRKQIARLDPTGVRRALFARRGERHRAKVGDVLMVTPRRGGEPFAGALLSVHRAGVDTGILLRGQLTKTSVEMWYKVYSQGVAGIDIVHRRKKRARRARLTYMRKPKHDMGDVGPLVAEWRKTRNILTTRRGAVKAAVQARAEAEKDRKRAKGKGGR